MTNNSAIIPPTLPCPYLEATAVRVLIWFIWLCKRKVTSRHAEKLRMNLNIPVNSEWKHQIVQRATLIVVACNAQLRGCKLPTYK